MFIEYNEAAATSRELYQRCVNAIRNHEWNYSQQKFLSLANSMIAASTSGDTGAMPRHSAVDLTSIALPRNVFFARTGRRYGVSNSEDHFIRDCPQANKSRLVYFVSQDTDEAVFYMTMNETLDAIQELPDQDWQVLLTTANEDNTRDEDSEEHAPAPVLLTHTADYAELSRLSPSIVDKPIELDYDTTAPCFFSTHYGTDGKTRLRQMVCINFT